MNLLSPRLRLRPFHLTDISANYISWLNDAYVTRFSNQRFQHHTFDSCSGYLKTFAGSVNSFLLIERREDQQSIGTSTVYRDINHGTANIGLLIGERSSWGQGFGGEAWQVVLEAVLLESDMRKVSGGTARLNQAMVRIMEQSGMNLEAVFSDHELIDGHPVDILHYTKFIATDN